LPLVVAFDVSFHFIGELSYVEGVDGAAHFFNQLMFGVLPPPPCCGDLGLHFIDDFGQLGDVGDFAPH